MKPYPPVKEDLERLHQLIIERQPKTVLEFGTGHSTKAIVNALQENGAGHLWCVDASAEWIENTKTYLNSLQQEYVTFWHSEVFTGTMCNLPQLSHVYVNLPDIVPDFVYLDGPAKGQAETIGGYGLTFDHRTPVSADMLLYESTLVPPFFMLIDGRTNNARFLERNFQRKYRITWDRQGDVTMFELDEEPLSYHKRG